MKWPIVCFLLLLGTVDGHKGKGRPGSGCGGHLTAVQGIIQTPGFPAPFVAPIKCKWVIEAYDLPPNNVSIVVYLTQLYVLKGLSFTEYAFYGTKYGERLIHTVTDQNVTKVRWIETHRPVLVIEFHMTELEGNQLRALDGLLDVYGFNITYEISSLAEPVRPNSCIVVDCSFVGHCYVSKDFTSFECACFPGFSGPNCGFGPHCEENRSVCQNGATCRHMGAQAVTCDCPRGYTGDNCAIRTGLLQDDGECEEHGCLSQCEFDGRPESVCNCPQGRGVSNDKARYEATLRLANLPASRDHAGPSPGRSLEGMIERQIGKFLKNSNISKMDDVRVLNITAGAEVTFHFFGAKKDGSEVRDALNRLVKRGRIGNLTLVPTYLAFRQDPTLLLQSVKVNRIGIIPEGDEFIISCTAQGSPFITFGWYKDGVFIDTTKATRVMWTHLHKLSDSSDQYTSRLSIAKATSLDEGVYTCQVVDWAVQQCKSVHIEVRLPPVVKVVPKSLTVQKGDNVSIVCMSPNDRHHEIFGYNWTKNKQLFKMRAATEVWEELYPAGSILRITNIQKSSVYSCEVIGYAKTTVDVRIEVLNKTVVPVCPEETLAGVTWPETSPGVYSIKQCPARFIGDAQRLCIMRNTRESEWDTPDFSSCFAETLLTIHNNFLRLTYGYLNTTASQTLDSYVSYLDRRTVLLPREGERILNLVHEVISYINKTNANDEVQNATRSLYKIVNYLLKQENSITDITKLSEMQRLVRNQALLSGVHTRTSNLSHHILDTLAVDVVTLETTTFHNLHFPLRRSSYPSWFSDKLDVRIESSSNEPFGNGSFTVAAYVYKNLSHFLPERSVAQLKSGNDYEMEIISKLVGISFGKEGRMFWPPPGTLWLDLELHHSPHNYSWEVWNTTCAVSDVASSGNNWDLESCVTRSFNSSLTRCSCTKAGTFAILITTRPSHMARISARNYQFAVLLGCMCCLIQAVVSLVVLVLYWWYHRSCLVYLKIQCCGATAGAMAVFLYVICNELRNESYSYITTCLQTFFLVGMSSHLSKILIVYTELVQMSRVRRIKPTVVGIITGVPVIAVFGNHLAHRSMGRQFESWWLISGTLAFTIFVISALVMFFLFVFLYFSVMRKLHLLSNKHVTNSKALDKRIGLLHRAAFIFISTLFLEVSSIFYINVPDISCQYVFSLSSAIFGFLLLLCYIIKSEISLCTHLTKKLKLDKNNEEFSSDSANSPLSFFHKQEPDAESESAPPRQLRGKLSSLDCSEGLLLADTHGKPRYTPSEGAPSTIETYLHSISEDSVERYDVEQRPDGTDDVNLELYNSSPKKYKKSPINAALYSESEGKYPEHWYVRGHPDSLIISPSSSQFVRDRAHPPDILTTRVCLELGLVPSSGNGILGTEANILVEAPTIMLCSVDVEPCDALELAGVGATERDEDTADASAEPEPPIKLPPDGKSEPVLERKQPEGREKVFSSSEVDADDDNLDGMLDRISHDLDYLLNRTVPEIQVTPAPTCTAATHTRKTSKPPSSSVRGQIVEEEEEEESQEEERAHDSGRDKDDSDMGIAKTAC